MTWLSTLLLCSSLAFAAPPPGAGGDRGGLTQAEVAAMESEILEVVGEEAPERHAELKALKASDPEAYWRAMRRLGKVYTRHANDPETLQRQIRIRDLDLQLREKAKGFEALSPAEQKARRAEMEVTAGELFELKQAHRKTQLEHLQERITTLEEEIGDREARKEEIIDDFLDMLINGKPSL